MFRISSPMLRACALILSFGCWTVACGGGGGGGGGGPGASVATTDMLITDAAVDELLAFTVKVTSLRLVDDATGLAGADVLDEDLSIDLIGAGLAPRWASRGGLPAGTYRAVRVTIDASSTSALDRVGNPVAVQNVATTFDVPFNTPATIAANGYQQVTLDIDLAGSLDGTVGAPPLLFDPQGVASIQNGAGSTSGIDEVKGIVRSINPSTSFVIDAFADGDQLAPLGEVTIHLTGTTVLLDDNGIEFGSVNDFFTSLVLNTTLVEVHGALTGGQINASRIEVEDDGGGTSYVVKLDGRIENLDTIANTFDLVVIEIEKGASVAQPVLDGLSNPVSIQVDYDDITTVFVTEDHVPSSESALATGQRVKVKFAVFAAEPFPAVRIEIEDQPEFEGLIHDVSGLPNSIQIRLNNSEPAIASGAVDNSSTNITVDLTGSTLFLDTHAKPTLNPAQLLVGLKLEVHGTLSGPSNGPTITAVRTKIHAGRFRGNVTEIFPLSSSFDASMNDLKDPFGDTVTFGLVAVDLVANCEFRDDANTASEFFGLFSTLQQGESLEVEVFGIGTSTPNQIDAFEIKAKVE